MENISFVLRQIKFKYFLNKLNIEDIKVMRPALVVIDKQKFFFNNEAREKALDGLVKSINDFIDQ